MTALPQVYCPACREAAERCSSLVWNCRGCGIKFRLLGDAPDVLAALGAVREVARNGHHN